MATSIFTVPPTSSLNIHSIKPERSRATNFTLVPMITRPLSILCFEMTVMEALQTCPNGQVSANCGRQVWVYLALILTAMATWMPLWQMIKNLTFYSSTMVTAGFKRKASLLEWLSIGSVEAMALWGSITLTSTVMES